MNELKEITLKKKFIVGEGSDREIKDFQKIYIKDLINKNKIKKKIKAVARAEMEQLEVFTPEILKGIGCDIIELDCKLDFTFPKYNPNPEDLKMLEAISK